ncbi:MAG: glycosyltransferase, partial [Longimicrobiaceae bacterium]
MTLAWVLLAGAPLLVLGIALFNLAVWPRPRPGARLPGPVSVLIPARDEAANIERCVRAALAQTHPADEVLVYDDRSSDDTAALVAALAVEEPRLWLLPGRPLPPGWVGKQHACHRLAGKGGGGERGRFRPGKSPQTKK